MGVLICPGNRNNSHTSSLIKVPVFKKKEGKGSVAHSHALKPGELAVDTAMEKPSHGVSIDADRSSPALQLVINVLDVVPHGYKLIPDRCGEP